MKNKKTAQDEVDIVVNPVYQKFIPIKVMHGAGFFVEGRKPAQESSLSKRDTSPRHKLGGSKSC